MPIDATQIARLEEIARGLRIDVLKMLTRAGSGHTGGSLSAVDIITTLYFHQMRHNPRNPKWEGRDRFVLSKGHGAPALYAALAHSGYFDPRELLSLRQWGSILQGHPFSPTTPGVEVSTGSLGQGLSMANGIALAAKLDNHRIKVYVLLGDGELQEGQVWEAAMSAAHYKLDNVCAIVDNNGLQIDGRVADIMSLEPLADKWRAFGWEVQEINGHDFEQIATALNKANQVQNKPSLIVAHTVKGKGVSFMEGQVKYHGIAPTPEELDKALVELGASSLQ
jgi:transketolase